jgi:hypothetical protein
MINCLYTNGDSWVHGSELIDPTRPDEKNHFHAVHEEYRKQYHWPNVVAQKLGVEYVDNSSPGSSNDRILRTSIYDISELLRQGKKPAAVIAWSQLHRFELPEGNSGLWRSFASPGDSDLPLVAKEVWSKWSGDYPEVMRWVTQLICLHSFCRSVGVPVLGLTVFSKSYRLLDDQLGIKEFLAYKDPLHNICNITDQLYQFSLESMLRQHNNVSYGPGGHPLAQGHNILGKIIAGRLLERIKTT